MSIAFSLNGRNVHPNYSEGISLQSKRQSGERFRRTELSEKLVFQGDDYAWIVAQPFDTKFVIHMDTGTMTWDGVFWKTDCEFDADDKTCAVMMELIQGESGVRPLNKDYVKAAYEYCKERDILFLVDEVQTGVGRTGKLFSYEHFDIQPDIISMAKGIGGGLPLGAVMVGEKCADVMTAGTHGSTFGGNPMVCTAANVVLDTVNTPEFLEEVTKKGEYLKEAVLGIGSPEICGVRGMGLMIGIVLANPEKRADFVKALLAEGVTVLTAGKDVIRLLPPLVITKEEMDTAIAAMKKVFC